MFKDPIHVGRPNIGSRAGYHALVDQILDRNWLTNSGPVVEEFESRIAAHLGVRNCVAVSNGTAGLELSMTALGVSGEVIVPAYTFIATAHAARWRGATPVFADIDPTTHNIDPESVRRRATPATAALVGVHLWGRPAPVDELQAIADDLEVPLLLDAAHAFGCSRAGRMIGSGGTLEVLSFHATKFFNTVEGGAIVTDDDGLADELRMIRNFGFAGYDNVVRLGTNAKMSELHAAMGLVNLDALSDIIETNRANHQAYAQAFATTDLVALLQFDAREQNNYQYVVIEVADSDVRTRDRIIAHLHDNNVLARRYFWPGCHRMFPYVEELDQNLPHLPSTELVAGRVIVLPTGTSVTPSDCAEIAELVLEAAS